MALNIPPKGDSFRRENAHFANLKVSAQDTPALTVKVSAGGFWNDDNTYVEVNGGTSPALTAPGSAAKLVVVAVNLSGTIVLIDGAPASSPSLPSIPSDRLPLATVLINSTDTVISQDMVFDLRPVFGIGADVNALSVSGISGLSSQLDLKADVTFVNNGLDTKAGIGGTASSVFALNANHTGVPTADASFRVERGSSPDVEIRWNETTEIWEFTTDGTNFEPITSGSSLSASLTSLQASVTANASSITVLQASVSVNDGLLTALTASIVALDASVLVHHQSISTLQASVTDLNLRVSSLEVSGSSNVASQFAVLTASTAANSSSLVVINASLVAHEAADASNFAITNASVAANASSITVIQASLAAVITQASENNTSITFNASAITTQSALITTLQASVTAVDLVAADNASAISDNASAITTLQASVVAINASVAQNASVIGTLVAASTHPVDLTAFRAGTLTDDTIFWIWPVGVSTTIPIQSVLGTALAGTASDGSATNIVIKHSASVGLAGSIIGTVKFPAAASAEGTVDVSVLAVVAPGDFLRASTGTITDSVIADIAFTITATKTTT